MDREAGPAGGHVSEVRGALVGVTGHANGPMLECCQFSGDAIMLSPYASEVRNAHRDLAAVAVVGRWVGADYPADSVQADFPPRAAHLSET